MSNMMTAQEVKQMRKSLGLTGDELGELLGVTGNTVRRWECGARVAKGPAVTMLRRLVAEKKRKRVSV